MKIIEKFGRLLLRLWPAWLPLLLLFVLPWARPFSRTLSDEIVGGISQIVTGQGPTSPMPKASAHPDDFDLQLWNSWHQQRQNYRYDYSERTGRYEIDAQKLRKKFRDEPLLVAPPIQHEMGMSSWFEPWYNYAAPAATPADVARELKALRTAATRGQQLEPDNAFWWVALAHVEWRAKHYEAALAALERAAKCSHYDDYTRDLARRLIRARQRYSAPSFFDKLKIIEDARSADANKLKSIAQLWVAHARRLRNKGDSTRALRWAGAMLVVGDLMQRDPNAWPTAEAGATWQSVAYKIVPPSKKGQGIAANTSIDFVRFARANGRADLAELTPKWAEHSRQVQTLARPNGGRYSRLIWLRAGNLDKWMNLLEGLPIMLVGNIIYLALWWLFANFCLWRARCAPSSRRDRVGIGATTTLALALIGLSGLWFVIDTSGGTTSFFMAFMGSLATFGFFGAPIVLALCCALITLRRNHARFNLPPRLDTELALVPWMRAFLRWFLPVCVLATAILFVMSWALWLLATARSWGAVDLLKLLPPDRRGFTGSLVWDSTGPTLLAYSVVLCVGCLLLWFWRWRWSMPADLRPLTQGALRWWKESLGVSIVALSWIVLVLAVASLPLFNRAEAQLERVLKVGELKVK